MKSDNQLQSTQDIRKEYGKIFKDLLTGHNYKKVKGQRGFYERTFENGISHIIQADITGSRYHNLFIPHRLEYEVDREQVDRKIQHALYCLERIIVNFSEKWCDPSHLMNLYLDKNVPMEKGFFPETNFVMKYLKHLEQALWIAKEYDPPKLPLFKDDIAGIIGKYRKERTLSDKDIKLHMGNIWDEFFQEEILAV